MSFREKGSKKEKLSEALISKKKEKADPLGEGFRNLTSWVSEEPLTRGPAVAVVVLYVCGAFATSSRAEVWVVLGICATTVVHTIGKKTGGPDWGNTLSGISASAATWMTACSITGNVATESMFLSYCAASTVLWLWWYNSDKVAKRRVWKTNQKEWAAYADDVGLSGSQISSVEENRIGFVLRVDIRGTSKIAPSFVGKDLASRVAAKHGLPGARVLVTEDPRNAGMIYINVREIDPWGIPNFHPLFDPEIDIDEFRENRTIAMPIVIGEDPETGKPLVVELFNDNGGQHTVIVAGTGGGKSTLMNSIIEHITDCDDVQIRIIDAAKGKDGRVWEPLCADVALGPSQLDQALAILRAQKERIVEKAANAGLDNVHKPTSSSPANVTIIDEASELLGRQDDYGRDARELVNFIMSKGRSEAEILIIAAQRGVLAHLGSGDTKANSFVKIVLGVSDRKEMGLILPNWADDGLPDMSKYGEGRKGVALIVSANGWATGRCFNLSSLHDVQAIVESRATSVVRETASGVALVKATTKVPPARPLKATPEVALEDPDHPDNVPGAPWATKASGLFKDLSELNEAYEVASSAVTALQDSGHDRWTDRVMSSVLKDQDKIVPDEIRTAVLEVAMLSGLQGATRQKIGDRLNLGRSQTAEWVRIMTNQGMIESRGKGRSTVYTLPMSDN